MMWAFLAKRFFDHLIVLHTNRAHNLLRYKAFNIIIDHISLLYNYHENDYLHRKQPN